MAGAIRRVAIVGSVRVPFARSFGAYMGVTTQELMTATLKGLVEKYKLHNEKLGEVALGAVIAHSSDWNLARECTLGSGLSPYTPAFGVQQACGTGLEACMLIANKIALGQVECGIGGGVDTNSDLPVVFSRRFAQKLIELSRAKTVLEKLKIISGIAPRDLKPIQPGITEPRTGLSMGQSCELMAKEWKIGRQEQDELALASQTNALRAMKEGFFNDLVIPFNGVNKDNNVRESSPEKWRR